MGDFMHFVCPRAELARALQVAIQAASTKSVLQIYRDVLMQVSEDRLKLTSYNGDVGFQVVITVQTKEPGAAAVPAKLLTEIIGNLPDSDVIIRSGDRNSVVVTCQRSECVLSGDPASDFPLLPEVAGNNRILIPAQVIRDVIRQTRFSVAHDQSRPALTGVSLTLKDGRIEAASTDTHRLSIREVNDPGIFGDTQVILPERALQQFARMLPPDAEDHVEVRLSERQAFFQYRDVVVVSRLIDGKFPPYQNIIPTNFGRLIQVDREEFLKAVKRIAVIANREESKRITLQTENGVIKLSTEVGGVGHAREVVEIIHPVDGDDIELAFNADYLSEVLSEIKSEMIRIEITGPITPCLIRAAETTEYRHILMPMQPRQTS